MPKDGTQTKELLANSLLKLINDDKSPITVKALVAKAGVNRQTFYYHFETIDDLILYVCQTRVEKVYQQLKSRNVHEQNGFLTITRFVHTYLKPIQFLLASKGRTWIKNVFYDKSYDLCKSFLEEYTASATSVDSNKLAEAAYYCTIASASIIESWISESDRKNSAPHFASPEEIATCLETCLEIMATGLLNHAPSFGNRCPKPTLHQ